MVWYFFLFSPLPEEIIQLDLARIFQMELKPPTSCMVELIVFWSCCFYCIRKALLWGRELTWFCCTRFSFGWKGSWTLGLFRGSWMLPPRFFPENKHGTWKCPLINYCVIYFSETLNNPDVYPRMNTLQFCRWDTVYHISILGFHVSCGGKN